MELEVLNAKEVQTMPAKMGYVGSRTVKPLKYVCLFKRAFAFTLIQQLRSRADCSR